MKVTKDQLEGWLAGYTHTDRLMRRYYERLLPCGELTDDLLPSDWDATEAELGALRTCVAGFDEHWGQGPLGEPRADLFAALAEIEALRVLPALGYSELEAVRFKPIKGGGAPDAVGVAEGVLQAFEVKSLWAYHDRRQHHFRRGPAGVFAFGKRPPGRSVVDALHRAGGDLPDGEWNSLILDLTLRRLLTNAAQQLKSYTRHHERPIAGRVAILVVTRAGRVLEFVDAGREFARAWLLRHRDRVTNVLWVGGGKAQWLSDEPPGSAHQGRHA